MKKCKEHENGKEDKEAELKKGNERLKRRLQNKQRRQLKTLNGIDKKSKRLKRRQENRQRTGSMICVSVYMFLFSDQNFLLHMYDILRNIKKKTGRK